MDVFQNLNWLFDNFSSILITVFSAILIYVGIVILTRINGLRTFAKMSSFDFAITIAIGSVIASTLMLEDQSVAKGLVGLTVLVALQAVVALLRKKSKIWEKLFTNTPVLLMEGSTILVENLNATRVSRSDLYAKLRAANVTHFDQVIAVVLETTGDMSVLHTGEPGKSVSKEIMKDVAFTVHKNNLPKPEGKIE